MTHDTPTLRDSEEPVSGVDAGPFRARPDDAGIRVVIVDDEPLARDRLHALLAAETDVEVVGECGDGWEAVQAIHALNPDLVFLDVRLPKLDGFEVLDSLGDGRCPSVVFVAADERHALRAFEVHATDYLLKPYGRERLQRALERVRREIPGEHAKAVRELAPELRGERHLRRIVVKRAGHLLLLRADEVDWIESAGNYLRLHVGSECHTVRRPISALESLLDPDQFLRIHRSTIVNADRIREMRSRQHGDYLVVLRDGTQLTLSATYRRKLAQLRGKEWRD
jgi:two-component system LytT family response regulator